MTICNGCGKETLRYHIIVVGGGKPALNMCHYCWKHPGDRKLTTFPFTTAHVDGSERVVNSLYHLRQLEREHGVQSAAYNMEESSFRDAPQQRYSSERGDGRGVSAGHGRR